MSNGIKPIKIVSFLSNKVMLVILKYLNASSLDHPHMSMANGEAILKYYNSAHFPNATLTDNLNTIIKF